VRKDLDSVFFRAWLRYLKLETAEDEPPVNKPDRKDYMDISCEVPILFMLDWKKEWVNDLKQTIFNEEFFIEN